MHFCRFLIDIRWLKQWKKYVGYDARETAMYGEEAANPGPIDNSNLLEGVLVMFAFLVVSTDLVKFFALLQKPKILKMYKATVTVYTRV